MKYAVVKTGGKQYKVAEGETLEVERLQAEPKKKIEFDQVLLAVDGDSVFLGQPFLSEAKVIAEVLEQFRGKKIRVAKFKAKAHYRRVAGYRQSLTRVKIEKIMIGKGKKEKKENKENKIPKEKPAKKATSKTTKTPKKT